MSSLCYLAVNLLMVHKCETWTTLTIVSSDSCIFPQRPKKVKYAHISILDVNSVILIVLGITFFFYLSQLVDQDEY